MKSNSSASPSVDKLKILARTDSPVRPQRFETELWQPPPAQLSPIPLAAARLLQTLHLKWGLGQMDNTDGPTNRTQQLKSSLTRLIGVNGTSA